MAEVAGVRLRSGILRWLFKPQEQAVELAPSAPAADGELSIPMQTLQSCKILERSSPPSLPDHPLKRRRVFGVLAESLPSQAARQILRTTFSTMPELRYLLVFVPSAISEDRVWISAEGAVSSVMFEMIC